MIKLETRKIRLDDDSFLRPRHFWLQAMVFGLIGSFSFAFLYAFIARTDEVAVVPGELKPAGNVSKVRAASAGIVKDILVDEGKVVKKGDVVLRLDQDVSLAQRNTLQQQHKLLKARLVDTQQSYEARESQLKSESKALGFSLSTQKAIVSKYKPLVEVGAIQEIQYLEQMNRMTAIASEYEQVLSRMEELKTSYFQSTKDIESQIAELNARLVEAETLSSYQIVKAPVSGMIFDLQPNRAGFVVGPSDLLFTVVPIHDLEANLLVTNQYIGFIKPGMPADVRVDAYPFTEYGSIHGRVKTVSSDALSADQSIPVPRFKAVVNLDRQMLTRNGKQFPLKSGQTVSANIVLRQRRVISLLTDIVQRSLDALRSVRG